MSVVNSCEFVLIKRVQEEAGGLNPFNIGKCKQVNNMIGWLVELERCSLKTELGKICCIQEGCIRGN